VMENKLTAYFEVLQPSEHVKLRKWLASPIHNESERLLQFYQAVAVVLGNRSATNGCSEADIIQKIWTTAFGDKPFKMTQWRLWCSDLTKQIQDFLAYHAWKATPLAKETALLKALQQQANNPLIETAQRAAEAKLTASQLRNKGYFDQQHELYALRNTYLSQQNQRNTYIYLADASEALDVAYLLKKLSYATIAIHVKNVLQRDVAVHGIAEVVALAQQKPFSAMPSVQVYLAAWQISATETEAALQDFTALLFQHFTLFEAAELRELYTFALNFCIKQINSGNKTYYQKIFELYQQLLATRTIFNNNELAPWDYKNIITTGLRLHEYDWVTVFLYEYNDNLPIDFRQNALTYNLAKLAFAKKEYPKVIELLFKVEYQDIFYNLDSRTTLLKTYYELEEYAAIETGLDTFRIYLLRNKAISIYTKKQYENFIKILKYLVNLPYNEPKSKQNLLKRLEKIDVIADKNWLREKIELR
jgi:hypothetical protein